MNQTTIPAGANPLGADKISTLIRRFSIPAIVSMLVNALYNMVDQVFIGQAIGMLGIAATNVAFPLTTISTAVALLLGIGGASNFNLKLGAGDKESASRIAGNTFSMLAICGVVIGAVTLLFIDPLLVAFGATPSVLPYAQPYTAIIAPGIPFLIFAAGAGHMIRADGSPTYAMGCVMAGAIFNLVFDPIFLFVFDMGIEGIALATTLGQILSASIAFVYLLKRFRSVPIHKEYLRPRARFVGAICSLGVASCFNQLAMTVVQITMNNTLRHYGALSPYGSDIPLACVGAISKLAMLFFAFPIGIAQGTQPIVSFNYGARRYDRVKTALRIALTAAGIISVVAFLIFQLFPRQLMSIFGEDDPLYLQFAVRYLRVYMAMTFVNGIQPITSTFFTSIGKARRGMLVSLTRQILFLMPLILLLPMFLGIDGLMYAGPIADAAAATVSALLIIREIRAMGVLQKQQAAILQPLGS
ncbi:MATE family efflux transporter [Ruminococcaceae bacterium OttesenSCG-928-O06]|nr:MATE family efflux transporter [Ruminococcaceae bacterium OttesenSCG-928-O06]